VYFPDFAPLYAVDVIAALETMYAQSMYNRLVFYLMACESGSMFSGILPPNISIYATAAAAPDVSAYPVFCSPLDLVNGQPSGKMVGNCLASEFGLAWTNETETWGLTQSLNQQYINVNASMITSHPGQYGDQTWNGLPIGDIFTDYPSGQAPPAMRRINGERPVPGAVSYAPGSFKLFMLEHRVETARTESPEASEAAVADLNAELRSRVEVDDLFTSFAARALRQVAGVEPTASALATLQASPALPIVHTSCMRQVDAAIAASCGGYTDYSRKWAGLVINTCRAVAEIGSAAEQKLPSIMHALCQAKGDSIRPAHITSIA